MPGRISIANTNGGVLTLCTPGEAAQHDAEDDEAAAIAAARRAEAERKAKKKAAAEEAAAALKGQQVLLCILRYQSKHNYQHGPA